MMGKIYIFLNIKCVISFKLLLDVFVIFMLHATHAEYQLSAVFCNTYVAHNLGYISGY